MQLPSLLGHVQELLFEIFSLNRPADSIIDSFFRSRSYLGSHDRRFIAETTYGTLRHLRRAQAILRSAFDGAPLTLLQQAQLLPSAYLLHIERRDIIEEIANATTIPRRFPSRAALEQIKAVTLPPPADELERLGLEYSFPDWLIERLVKQYGIQETESLLRSLNEQAPITLRVNTVRCTVEECRLALAGEEVESVPTRYSTTGLQVSKRVNVFGLKAFQEGWFEVQDEGSQLLCLILDPKRRHKVLDACAGAGGKSLALSAIMKNSGEIIATDVNEYRIRELRRRIARAGATNIRPKLVSNLENLVLSHENFFDLVLVDAPCTGTGTVRRNPGLKWSVTEKSLEELVEKQKSILKATRSLVKPGGRLAYVTCSLLKEENEAVIKWFLRSNEEYEPVDPAPLLARLNVPDAQSDRFIKFLPHIHGTDGFFCAILQRKKAQPAAGPR